MGNAIYDLPDGLYLQTARHAATHPPGRVRQEDIAKEMGVARWTVSRIENSSALPKESIDNYLAALKAVLDAHPDWRPR